MLKQVLVIPVWSTKWDKWAHWNNRVADCECYIQSIRRTTALVGFAPLDVLDDPKNVPSHCSEKSLRLLVCSASTVKKRKHITTRSLPRRTCSVSEAGFKTVSSWVCADFQLPRHHANVRRKKTNKTRNSLELCELTRNKKYKLTWQGDREVTWSRT